MTGTHCGTHYLPAYTEKNGVHFKAACGAWISLRQHSTTPDCESCATYLLAEADTDKAMEALAAEPFDPALAVEHVDFDPTRDTPGTEHELIVSSRGASVRRVASRPYGRPPLRRRAS